MSETTHDLTQRYNLVTNYRCGSAIEEMEQDDDGEWARWEAVLVMHDRLLTERNDIDKKRTAEIERLSAALVQAEQREAKLHALVMWALGEGDDDLPLFPDRPDDWKRRPLYWRTELRALLTDYARSTGMKG